MQSKSTGLGLEAESKFMMICVREKQPTAIYSPGRCRKALLMLGVVACLMLTPAFAQVLSRKSSDITFVEGTVFTAAGTPVEGASVVVEGEAHSTLGETKTKKDGTFLLSVRGPGTYTLTAQKPGFGTATLGSLILSAGERKHADLTLQPEDAKNKVETEPAAARGMEFEDKPSFTIAGVTDWSGAGGHGSDTSLRTSESLARETLTLKPDGGKEKLSNPSSVRQSESESKLLDALPQLEAAHQAHPADSVATRDLALGYQASGNFARAAELVRNLLAHEEQADLHRWLGDLNEQSNDPLAAVHEYEKATRLDPSELNYFEWGTELLLHRAIQPAVEVLSKGALLHAGSARLLSALGAALYAGGDYDQAALRLCAASDLIPSDPTPYLFLGKMERASPQPLPCVDQKMARFVKEQPGNALANYHYALALWKRQKGTETPAGLQPVEELLEKAVAINPQFEEAYLQLGILYFTRGDFERSIGAYKKAIAFNPNFAEPHYRLGVAYKRLGRKTEAEQEFRTHEQLQKAEAAAVERQRREVRQFMIVLRGQRDVPATR